ncbi:MAG: phosphatidate cytidylyltransferase [Myxococcales bacterium]|nr:phosphatidate cytidylyltransferase [Myxococcales bacterium]
MLLHRVLTAVVLAPLLVWLVVSGPNWGFALLILVAQALALDEFLTISLGKENRVQRQIAHALGAFFVGAAYFAPSYVPFVAAAAPMVLFLGFLAQPEPIPESVRRWGLTVGGVLYVSYLLSFFVPLKTSSGDGRFWVLLVFIVVWFGDTGAYFAGRAFGKHKLYELISPKKTIEGSLGGLVAGVIGSILFKVLVFHRLSYLDCVLVALPAGILEQLGDLCESMLKRAFGAKDSGTLLPGHGGLLDRIDGVLFAVPYVYVYMYLISTR